MRLPCVLERIEGLESALCMKTNFDINRLFRFIAKGTMTLEVSVVIPNWGRESAARVQDIDAIDNAACHYLDGYDAIAPVTHSVTYWSHTRKRFSHKGFLPSPIRSRVLVSINDSDVYFERPGMDKRHRGGAMSPTCPPDLPPKY